MTNIEMSINYSELENIVKSEKLDYIAFAVTPWHAHAIVAAVHKLELEHNEKMKGIVLILKNHNESYLINEKDFFSSLSANVYYFPNKKNKKQLLELYINMLVYSFNIKRSNKKNFYVLTQLTPALVMQGFVQRILGKDINICTVICDEGIGSYLSNGAEISNSLIRNEKLSVIRKIKIQIEQKFFIPYVKKKLINNDLYRTCYLLTEQENGNYNINLNTSRFFVDAIETYSQSLNSCIEEISEPYILINTTPFLNANIQEYSDNIIKKVVEIINKHNYLAVIKPHPREVNIEKYRNIGAILIDRKDISQECMLINMQNKPDFMISYYSTTLVTVPLLCGVPSIGIGNVLKQSNYCDACLEEAIDKFNLRFQKITNVIKDLESLELILSE